jgi:sarcosine oxidase subunit beta
MNVLVVDRNAAPGMGSTARANGGVRAQFATPTNVVFSQYTIAGLIDLDEMTGGQVGYRPVGYLLMAGTDLSAEALESARAMQCSLGVPTQWLSLAQVAELAPFVRVDGLTAATFCASDGIIDPHGVVGALCGEGGRLGVTYLFDTHVIGLEHDGTHALLHCSGVDIEADYVVNAAGAVAGDLATKASIELPVVPYRRNLACTEPVPTIPASIPMCVDVDTGVLIRREGDGILIGYSDPASAPTLDSSFEPEFLDAVASRVGNRFPFLEEATINPRKCWAGLYPETPDHIAIIDAPRGAPWFIQCAGFGGHGIMHSLAAGQAVAELIRDQRCSTFDLYTAAARSVFRFDTACGDGDTLSDLSVRIREHPLQLPDLFRIERAQRGSDSWPDGDTTPAQDVLQSCVKREALHARAHASRRGGVVSRPRTHRTNGQLGQSCGQTGHRPSRATRQSPVDELLGSNENFETWNQVWLDAFERGVRDLEAGEVRGHVVEPLHDRERDCVSAPCRELVDVERNRLGCLRGDHKVLLDRPLIQREVGRSNHRDSCRAMACGMFGQGGCLTGGLGTAVHYDGYLSSCAAEELLGRRAPLGR